MNLLLTGASGFVGKRVATRLLTGGVASLTNVCRSRRNFKGANSAVVETLDGNTDWSNVLINQDVVIHTAAIAHTLESESGDPVSDYHRINVVGTLNIARQAAAAGVKRFIFISSLGVNGNINTVPFTEADEPSPAEPYAQSKLDAENGLWEIQRETGMQIVIIRPPLVYGPNAPGNFGSLVNWVSKGIPLPLGAVNNKRSLVALDNLVDLIITCIYHPAAANQIFLAGDGEDISTTNLLRGVAKAMGKPSHLIPVPTWILMFAASCLGKRAVAQRLLGSLQVDISKARKLLGWTPPIPVEEGLLRCFESSTETDTHQ